MTTAAAATTTTLMSISSSRSRRSSSGSTATATARRRRDDNSRIVQNLPKVIFPDGKWIKRWDLLVLLCLLAYLFILPYQIGVSGGAHLLTRMGWLVFNVLINTVFFIDTFLYFRRPYTNENGRLVIDLKKIRWNYLTGWCIPNIISVLPYTLVFYFTARDRQYIKTTILLFNLFKLIRFSRLPKILSESGAVTDFKMKRNSQVIQFFFYVFLIVVISHWFACIWCWTAFLENGNFNFMLTSNWISGWVESNGGVSAETTNRAPNPIGPLNDPDRYVLALFWSIQTITSIGYGNIAPVTVVEWWVGSVLQLLAGVCWAYVIGGLVGVAAGFNHRDEEYRQRSDQANNLIKDFYHSSPDNNSNSRTSQKDTSTDANVVAKRIRKYIYKQYKHSQNTVCMSGLNDNFPVFDSLSPDLQRLSSVLLMKVYLDAVPYLSSRYLNTKDQADVAMQCLTLEFPAGEVVHTDPGIKGLGRGVLIMKSGCAFASKNMFENIVSSRRRLLTVGTAVGAGETLIEDGNPYSEGDAVQFLTYSQVLFIPRDVVWEALEKNDGKAWVRCGRWVYARTLLVCKCAEV